MKSPLRVAIGAVLLSLLIGFGVRRGWVRDPSFEGRTLGEWIEQYFDASIPGAKPGSAVRASAARHAIQEIGTNAIPALLLRVKARDSRGYRSILEYARRQSWIRVRLPSAEDRRNRADWGFAILRESGQAAVPALVELLRDSDPGVRGTAARCLGHIGPAAEPAIPAILSLLDERNQGLPMLAAMDGLRSIHGRPDLVIPAMMRFLNGDRTGWNYSVPAMDVLYAYGPAAATAVPAISAYLTHPDSDKRNAADSALLRIDPGYRKRASRGRTPPADSRP